MQTAEAVGNNLDSAGLTGYTGAMVKQSPDDEGENLVLLGVKVTPDVLDAVIRIKNREKRTKSQVGALLLERGLKAYERDGLLLEPEEVKGRKSR